MMRAAMRPGLGLMVLPFLSGCLFGSRGPAPEVLAPTPMPQESAIRLARTALPQPSVLRADRITVETTPDSEFYLEGRTTSMETATVLTQSLAKDPHFTDVRCEWGSRIDAGMIMGIRGRTHVHPWSVTLNEARRMTPALFADVLQSLQAHDKSGLILRRGLFRETWSYVRTDGWKEVTYDLYVTPLENESIPVDTLVSVVESTEAHHSLLRVVRVDIKAKDGSLLHGIVRMIAYFPPAP